MTDDKKILPSGTLIIRSPRNADSPYFASSRAAAQDERISYEAGGLLWYLLSKPNNWETRIPDLQKKGAGRDKVYNILRELKEAGYITRPCYRKEDGTFVWGDYQVHERPLTENPDTVNPDTAQPDTVKPEVNTNKRGVQNRESNKKKKKADSDAAAALLKHGIDSIIEVWVKGWEGAVSGNPYSNKTNRADAKKLVQSTNLEDIKRYTLGLAKPGSKWENARPSWGIWFNDLNVWLAKNATTEPTPNDSEEDEELSEAVRKALEKRIGAEQ